MTEKIKSDGGSSRYYEIRIPKNAVKDEGDSILIEAKHIIRYALDNDFSKGNVFKALVRLGQKDGTDVEYDRKKMHFFVDDICDSEMANKAESPQVVEEDEWIDVPQGNRGRPYELREDTAVEVTFRNGLKESGLASRWKVSWRDDGIAWDIIKYRVLSK